jgi:hypothetical protein
VWFLKKEGEGEGEREEEEEEGRGVLASSLKQILVILALVIYKAPLQPILY